MEPYNYNQVKDEYEDYRRRLPAGETPLELGQFAQEKDRIEGTNIRQSSYNPNFLTKAGGAWTRLTEATAIPQMAEVISRKASQRLGASQEITDVVGDVSRTLPEMLLAGFLSGGLGLTGEAATAAKALGYGLAGLQGANHSNSSKLSKQLLGAAINAGTFKIANTVIPKVGNTVFEATQTFLNRNVPKFVAPAVDAPLHATNDFLLREVNPAGFAQISPALPMTAKIGSELVGMTGINEAARQGMMSVQGVPLTDFENRNPFTTANVIGQAVGLIPFIPAFAKSIINAPKLNASNVKALSTWLKDRAKYVDTAQKIAAGEVTLDRAIEGESAKKVNLNRVLFENNLESLRNLKDQGDMDAYDSLLKDTVKLYNAKPNLQTIVQKAVNADTIGRTMPMQNEGELAGFISQVNDLIREYHNLATSIPKFEKQLEDFGYSTIEQNGKYLLRKNGLPVAKDAVLAPDIKAAFENLQHARDISSKARDPKVIEQLTKQGFLPQITEESLKKDYNFAFDRSIGDPQTAMRMVVQKQVNKLLDLVEPALARQNSEVKVETELNAGQIEENKLNEAYINALVSLPPHLQKLVAFRDGHIQETLQLKGQTGESNTKGTPKPQSYYPRWREAVIQAANTFDPETGTFQYKVPKSRWNEAKGQNERIRDENGDFVYETQTLPIEKLYERKGDNVGEYTWTPKTSEIRDPSFGKRTTSLDSFVGDNMSYHELMSGKTVEEVINEGGTVEGVSSGMEKSVLGGADSAAVPLEYNFSEFTDGKSNNKLTEAAKNITRNVSTSSPVEIWNKVKDLFTIRSILGVEKSSSMNDYRQRSMKLAIEAALESYGSTGKNIGPKGNEFLTDYAFNRNFKHNGLTPRARLQNALTSYFGGVNKYKVNLQEIFTRLSDGIEFGEKRHQGFFGTSTTDRSFVILGKETSFGQDIFPVLNSLIKQKFGDYGYSGDMRTLYTQVAAGLAVKLKDLPAELFNLDSKDLGLATFRTKEKTGVLALDFKGNLKAETTEVWLHDLLSTVIHEVAHIDSFIRQGVIDNPDAMSDQRRRQLENFDRIAEILSPEGKNAIIVTLSESLQTPDTRTTRFKEPTNTSLVYGALDKPYTMPSDEFNSMIHEIIGMNLLKESLYGTHGSKKTAWNVLDFLPAELSDYARGTVRSIGDIIEAAQTTLEDPKYRNKLFAAGRPLTQQIEQGKSLGHAFRSIVETAKQASRFNESDKLRQQAINLIQANEANGSYDGTRVSHFMTKETWNLFQQMYPDTSPTEIRYSPMQVVSNKYYPPTPKVGNAGGMKRFYPFFNLLQAMEKQGIPLARDVEYLARGIKASVNRMISNVYEPFTVKDASGKPVLDKANPLWEAIAEDPHGKWRDALNEVRMVQNENEGKMNMFVKDPQTGVVSVEPKLAKEWIRISKNLTQEEKQIVMSGSVSLSEAYKIAAGHMLIGVMSSNVDIVAGLLMSKNKTMTYDTARQTAGDIVDLYFSGRVTAASKLIPPDQFEDVAKWISNIEPEYRKLQQALDSRPGHSTESLPYNWILKYKTPQGKIKFFSAKSQKAAENLATKLIKDGNVMQGEILDRNKFGDYNDYDTPDNLLSKYMDVEATAWNEYLKGVEAKHGSKLAQELRNTYTPGQVTSAEMQKRGFGKYLSEQKGLVDRSRYDYLEGFENWVPRVSASIQYKSVRNQLNLMMRDPRLKGYDDFQHTVRTQFDYIFSPTSEWVHEMTSLLGGYFLAGNLSSAAVEMTQGPTVLVPMLIKTNKSGGIVKAYRQLWKGIRDAVHFSRQTGWKRIANLAGKKDPKTWTSDETAAWGYAKAVEEGTIDHGVIQDIAYSRDVGTLTNTSFGTGKYTKSTPGRMTLDLSYIGMQHLMRLYSWSPLFNNKLGFLTGIRQAHELGLRGQEAYDHALRLKDMSQFGGGKANTPAFVGQWGNEYTRSPLTVMKTLQQFGFGMFATYAETARDAVMKNPNLTSGEKLQAKKALGTMFITQVAISGTFGLPFAGAALTALEKIFGIEAHKAVKEGLAKLGQELSSSWTDDKDKQSEAGAMLSDLVLNGAGNQLFGLDLSSRVGVSNLFGTSAYRGFNIQDMLGPAPSVVGNVVKALGLFSQGEPMLAARSLMPQAFKNIIEMADTKSKYNTRNFYDSSGALLYSPTYFQSAMYGIGFRPAELSAKRNAQEMFRLSEQNTAMRKDRELDNAARALSQGDNQPSIELIRNLMAVDSTMSPESIMRTILNRSADIQSEKDLILSGVRGHEAKRLSMAKSVGSDIVPQRSELEYTRLKQQLAARIGRPDLITNKDYKKAAMVDMLTKNRGMTRSEALRIVSFLNAD